MKNKIMTLLMTTLLIIPTNIKALEKEETIFTNLDYNGRNTKQEVHTRLHINTTENIVDQTNLKNILNINGKEKYDDKSFTWKAEGKDIIYSGETNKENPIIVSTKYFINGDQKDLKEIIGQEGNITISIDFKNKLYDQNTGLYTPFVVMLGTTLDNNNTNIKVTNGKVVNNGRENILIGVASPGLYDSINIEQFKNLNNITITFKTKKLNLKEFYIVATPKLLEDTDLSIFEKMDELNSSIQELQENMDKIEKGVKELDISMDKIVDGSNSLKDNINLVNSSVEQLKNGSITLDTGVKQILNALENAKTSIKNKNLEGSIENLKYLQSQNTSTINVLYNTNTTLEDTYNKYNLSNDEQTLINNFEKINITTEQQEKLLTIKKTYEANVKLIELLSANNEALNKSIDGLNEMLGQVNGLIDTLNNNLINVSEGLTNLSGGLQQLKMGTEQLYNGSINLYNGTIEYKKGVSKLSNGITNFNNQGIRKLSNFSYQASDYSYKMKKLIELSENYNGYGSDNATKTTFIYKMKMS